MWSSQLAAATLNTMRRKASARALGSQAQPIDDVEELRVVVRADLSKVELAQRAERLTMDLRRPGADGHSDGS